MLGWFAGVADAARGGVLLGGVGNGVFSNHLTDSIILLRK